MPYSLRGKCVVRSDIGEVVKCHPSPEAARRHLAALKINVEESSVLGALLEERRAGRRIGRPRVRESEVAGVGVLVEAFAAASNPQLPENPQQSRVRGAQDVAKARAEIRWDESKHPRGRGGKFGSKGGVRSRGASRRARKGSPGQGNTLTVGTRGALVGAVQRQLGITADGVYGPQTRGAVERFQQQHGLQVDGRVGRQTLAALRGIPNAQSIAVGPISSKSARVVNPPKSRSQRTSKAPVRMSGGMLV